MERLQVFGLIPFIDQFDKRKKVFQLKSEFGQDLLYKIEDNFITYELEILQ